MFYAKVNDFFESAKFPVRSSGGEFVRSGRTDRGSGGGTAGSEHVVSCRNPSVGGAVDLLTDRYQTVPVQPAGTHLRVRRTKRPAERIIFITNGYNSIRA